MPQTRICMATSAQGLARPSGCDLAVVLAVLENRSAQGWATVLVFQYLSAQEWATVLVLIGVTSSDPSQQSLLPSFTRPFLIQFPLSHRKWMELSKEP